MLWTCLWVPCMLIGIMNHSFDPRQIIFKTRSPLAKIATSVTDAPIICDDAHTIDDEGTFVVYPEAQVWWFPNYMIEDPVNTLMTLGEVVFMAAPTEGGGTSR